MLIMAASASRSAAQTDGVVADMSSHKPLRDVIIITDRDTRVTTDYRGHFSLCGSYGGATIMRKGYMKRNMTAAEMRRDTIFLIPDINTLQGVEIVAPSDGRVALKKSIESEMKALPKVPKSGWSFDFGSLFDRSKRRVSKKERARQKQILDNY